MKKTPELWPNFLNGKQATRLRRIASELGLEYKALKRQYKRLARGDTSALETIKRIRSR